ncbi:sugar phosphate isomerase/epimerase [Anaerolineales bacterium HSG6]|nr:sugar phosphate isomerase/epimerase [Anaerolineales bacterium HSG6]
MKNNLLIAAERVTGKDEFERYLKIAKQRDLGMEVQEFYLPDLIWGDWHSRLDEYKKLLQDFQGDLSIHNAFLSIDHLGLDPKVFEWTRKRYDFIFMIAKELGCKVIVSHFTWNPFATDEWLHRWQEGEIKFWDHYVNIAEKEGFVLVGENTAEPRPEIIKPIIDTLNSDKFKFVLDVGHTNLHSQVPLETWLTTFDRDLVYMHVHNNYKNYDTHSSVFKGTINFDNLFTILDKLDIAPSITTEIYENGLLESLDYLQEKIKTSQTYQKH